VIAALRGQGDIARPRLARAEGGLLLVSFVAYTTWLLAP